MKKDEKLLGTLIVRKALNISKKEAEKIINSNSNPEKVVEKIGEKANAKINQFIIDLIDDLY